MTFDAFFAALWSDFVRLAPAAASIHDALVAAGETVVNDHIAFRTFNRGPIALDKLEPHLLALGYERGAPYLFEDKGLRAFGYTHPNPAAPLVFLSELLTERLSVRAQADIDALIAQLPADFVQGPQVFWSGRPWAAIDHATYTRLQAESEYAAWTAAHGFHANHFTVRLNDLSESLRPVESILAFVEARGFRVNASGGRVKGTPADLLEQGSILADRMPVTFADGEQVIPTCYYEFALRHRQADGSLYAGFVAASADRIFESTDARTAA